jgi:replicative superfamily II helicase
VLTESFRALLEVIATKLATSKSGINDYIRKTLLYHSIDHGQLSILMRTTLKNLCNADLIALDTNASFGATLLGEAIVASSLTPEDGIFIYKQLRKATQAFVLDGEMHVLYTFTPVQGSQTEVDWQLFRREMDCLDESGLRVLGLVGVKPTVVNKLQVYALL